MTHAQPDDRPRTVRLLVECRDRPGIVAAVTGFIRDHRGNIVYTDQHTDRQADHFSMRLELDPASLDLGRDAFERAFAPIAGDFELRWRLDWRTEPRKIAILVSRQDHCLTDLLFRWRRRELEGEVALVISNHERARRWVESVGVPYHCLPVGPETKADQESRVAELCDAAGVELLVLARYMQVLSPALVARYPSRVINIHHSFLPAFPGAKPYHRAFERGVKLIGATSHYVTDELDEGPIIAQATAPVDHRDTVDDLVRIGRDLERVVLAQAVRLHLQDRVIVAGRRTVVFEK